MTKARPKTSQTVAKNIQMLIDHWPMDIGEVAKRAKVSRRHIQFILRGERDPSIGVTEQIAGAFGLDGWHLLLLDLDVQLAKQGRLSRLLENYQGCPDASRTYIDQVAERDSKYGAA